MTKLATALACLVAIAFGVVVHELVHSAQGVVLGNGWHWPEYGPWTCGYGPNGFPGIACTEVGDGFAEHWWSGEAFAYAVQLVVTLAAAIGLRAWLKSSPEPLVWQPSPNSQRLRRLMER